MPIANIISDCTVPSDQFNLLLKMKTGDKCCKTKENTRKVSPKDWPVTILFKVGIDTPKRAVNASYERLQRRPVLSMQVVDNLSHVGNIH